MLNNTQKRLAIIAFFIGLNIVLGAYFLSLVKIDVPLPLAQMLYQLGVAPNTASSVQDIANPVVAEPDLQSDKLLEQINKMRSEANVDSLTMHPNLTKAAAIILGVVADNEYDTSVSFEDDVLENALKEANYSYVWVNHNALVGPLSVGGVLTAWQSDENQQEALLNEEFTDAGIVTQIIDDPDNGKSGIVIQLLGTERSSQSGATADEDQASLAPPVRDIPDSEVISALNAYRASHKLPALNVNANLCTYAEKRAADLAAYGGLDGHEGFRSDFADPENLPVGIADYSKGRKIGENLAHQHCKNMSTGDSFVAETGTALIEWCFDSSTKGHREAQLSREFQNVCVRHQDKMYVVIFGE